MSEGHGPIVGVLLAGGLARRMGGGDKCLQRLGGRTLLARALETAAPQVGPLILNAAGDPARFQDYGVPVVADVIDGFAGPLAGVLTGMEWASRNQPDAHWLATFPTDAPFFPGDLVTRMLEEIDRRGADMACALSNDRTHPVFALWPVRLADALRRAMLEEEMRKLDLWTSRFNIVHVSWPVTPHDPFFNINRPEDLERAEALLKEI